jgi:hypothetical protein
MLYYVHSSLFYNFQILEATQMFLNVRMDTEKMWYIYTMGYNSAIKNNDFMKFSGKWMELENIILSEITQTQKDTSTQTQKDTHGVHSLISGY